MNEADIKHMNELTRKSWIEYCNYITVIQTHDECFILKVSLEEYE